MTKIIAIKIRESKLIPMKTTILPMTSTEVRSSLQKDLDQVKWENMKFKGLLIKIFNKKIA